MTRSLGTAMLLLGLTLVLGCIDPSVRPDSTQVADHPGVGKPVAPPRYFTHYWTDNGVSLETVDVVHGTTVPFLDNVVLNDPDKGYAIPLGVTFDVDGSMYTIVDWLYGPQAYPSGLAELFKIDLNTGVATSIAQLDNHFCGSEIDACGNLYTVGFQPASPPDGPNHPDLGEYYAPDYRGILCRINKYDGDVTPIGDTGLWDIMDLAFDSHGTLWATTHNKLYTLDLNTGSATLAANITGVPPADPQETEPMMVMSIAFDKHDNLYGTSVVGFCTYCEVVAHIFEIDAGTGEATLLGSDRVRGTNHGGDTLPTEVRVAHRSGGKYSCIMIGLDDLPAHLAHGDYVPGTAGHSCDCP